MKIPFLTIAALSLIALQPAQASIFQITPDLQACTADAECTAVSDSCTKACATVPVNTGSVEKLEGLRLQTCGDAVKTLPTCATYPPLEPRCVNNRCTVGFAFDNNADDHDYGRKAGGHSGKGAAADHYATPTEERAYKDGSGFLELPAGYQAGATAPKAAPRSIPSEALAPPETLTQEDTSAPEPAPQMEPAPMAAEPMAEPQPAEAPAPAATDESAVSPPVPGPARRRMVPSETVEMELPQDTPQDLPQDLSAEEEPAEEVNVEDPPMSSAAPMELPAPTAPVEDESQGL